MARPSSSTRCAESRAARGAAAEQAAADFLGARRHRILLRNYRCRMGELDLVTLSPEGTLVVAEVRLRSRQDYGGGAASVDHRKQQRLLRASLHLLATHPHWAQFPMRFDVMDLQPAPAGFEIRWIQHAFSA
ncbi:MAG: YraN family protein [Proteobacteria bacterium]|nr:YraN family protein [Pseudomonadota bacterium]